VPALEVVHLQDCLVLPDRDVMIREHLPRNAVVAEVGVFAGANAATILDGARPRELHLIDVDLSRLQPHVLEPGLGEGIVHLHEQDSATALASFPDEYFDWIYLDGDHTYLGVKRDIEQAKRKVKRDGLLVFNDYILFSHNELMFYGVIAAVHELCRDEGWAFRYFALAGGAYCDVAVGRLPAAPTSA
jgi:hypothetical protein